MVSLQLLFADIQIRVKKLSLTPSLSFITGHSGQSLLDKLFAISFERLYAKRV